MYDMQVKTRKSSISRPTAGAVHRFGKNGVLYEVLRAVDDTSVMIQVLDTKEKTLYPIANVAKDPTN
jgi:hypothetical protein